VRGGEGGGVGGGDRGGGRRGRAAVDSGSLAGNLGANFGAVDTGGVGIIILAPCRCCHRRWRRRWRRRCGAAVHGRRRPPTSRSVRPVTWACSALLIVLLTPLLRAPFVLARPLAGCWRVSCGGSASSRFHGCYHPSCCCRITVRASHVYVYVSLLHKVLGCPLGPLWHRRKLSCTELVLTVILRSLYWLLWTLLATVCLWHCTRRRPHVGAQLVRMATTV